MLDWIELMANAADNPLTKEKFGEIRRGYINGSVSEEEMDEAVEQMLAAGGYDALG